MVTELLFVISMPIWIGIILSVIICLSIGVLIVPIAKNVLKVHQGFNLYNIGFAAGILGTVYVSILKSFGYTAYSRLIWSTGNNWSLGVFLYILFILMIIIGFVLEKHAGKKLLKIFKHPGILSSNFVSLEGFEPVLINMGINGLVSIGYVLLVRGELNGPTIGGILAVVGFGAFGKHIRNITPIFIGVFLSSIIKTWNIDDPTILIAALFGTSLAPIAGYYGWFWGIVAGFINSSVVLNLGTLHGGMNLYNTGFSAGIVATFLVPILGTFCIKRSHEDS
ncbi:MAG: DUF1576 domain-containing protein [Clostridiales bacterium]|nr:DUF1576 domain-containing protein [Clostridiales bacterium]